MPYIKQDARQEMAVLETTRGHLPTTAGELNYAITMLCIEYLGPTPRYNDFNEIIGVLECAKLEFYRRAAAPYEDTKIAENGDVYP